jgi:hypothetical protein
MQSAMSDNNAGMHKPSFWDWLFRPFVYIAGGSALGLGLVAIVAAALLGWMGHTHFDGVVDAHTNPAATFPVSLYLAEGFIDWLCLAIILLIIGKIFSKSSFRALDLVGTQALARWPTVLVAALCMIPVYQHAISIIATTSNDPAIFLKVPIAELGVMAVILLISVAAIVLEVALMYKSYSLCCNIKGGKGAVTFIAGVLIAEIISKVLLVQIMHYVSHEAVTFGVVVR